MVEEEKQLTQELHGQCYLRTKADGMKEYNISIEEESVVLSRQSKRGMSKLSYALNSL